VNEAILNVYLIHILSLTDVFVFYCLVSVVYLPCPSFKKEIVTLQTVFH